MTAGELTIVLAAVILGSTVKAVTGMGLPLVVVPVASLFVDLQDAIVVIALPNLLSNVVLGGREWSSRHETRDLGTLATAGVIGAVVGTLVLVNVPEKPLLVALAATVLGYVVFAFVDPDTRISPSASRRLSPVVGTVAGAFQGAVGISGPIVGAWIHSYRLPRNAHILSVTLLFAVTGLTQLVVLVAAGELDGRVTATLVACVPVLLAIPFGTTLRARLSRRGFDRAVLGLLLVSGVALCVRIAL